MAAGVEGLARVDGVQNNLVAYDHLEWKGPTELFSKQASCAGQGGGVVVAGRLGRTLLVRAELGHPATLPDPREMARPARDAPACPFPRVHRRPSVSTNSVLGAEAACRLQGGLTIEGTRPQFRVPKATTLTLREHRPH